MEAWLEYKRFEAFEPILLEKFSCQAMATVAASFWH